MVWRFFFLTSRERQKKERKRGPKNVDTQAVSTTEETAKLISERLYLVSGPHQLEDLVTIPYAPTPPSAQCELFLDFPAFSVFPRPTGIR